MNKKTVKILAFILLLWPITHVSRAESFHAVMEFNEADAIVLSANMLMNGSMGGTGAYLTAHPNAGLKDFPKMMKSRVYWRGFGQGMIGGSLVYTGMKTMSMQPEFEYSVLAGKQISDLGTSITYSASENQNWLANPSFITDIGPFVFHWRKSTGFKPEFFILPDSLYYIVNDFMNYNFETDLSLKTGFFVFTKPMEEEDITSKNKYRVLSYISGFTHCNDVILNAETVRRFHMNNHDAEFWISEVLSHEAIHTRWNYFQFIPIDNIFDSGLDRLPDEIGWIRLYYLKYDHHPFRFGPFVMNRVFQNIGGLSIENGSPEEKTILEYPSHYLINVVNY